MTVHLDFSTKTKGLCPPAGPSRQFVPRGVFNLNFGIGVRPEGSQMGA